MWYLRELTNIQKAFWGGVLAVIVVVAAFLFIPSGARGSEATVNIEDGMTLGEISETLKATGLIRSNILFTLYAYALGVEGSLQAGEYRFALPVAMPSVVSRIAGGGADSSNVKVTIPEGYNVWDIDAELVARGLIVEGDFVKLYVKDEGMLFPDTYRFRKTRHVSELTIPEREQAARQIGEAMKENFREKAGSVDMETLIIASMLEKEVRTEHDMRLVAGIIKTRQELGRELEVDATVKYGACLRILETLELFKPCDVSRIGVARELLIDGAYNTYTRLGLPPAPISNPGLRAIEAAQNPEDSDYLYYLTAPDGTTIYASNGVQHTANRTKYLGL